MAGFFSTFSQVKQSGFDFGSNVLSTVKQGIVDRYNITKQYAAAVYDENIQAAKNVEGTMFAKGVGKLVDNLTKDKGSREELVKRIDSRSKYKYKLVQDCPNKISSHPNPNDGRFMGKDCCQGKIGTGNHNTDHEPSEGRKPSCYTGDPVKEFKKIYYQNGMNNTEEVVCETMQQIADSQCAEVIGIYNATYADPTRIQAPEANYSDVKRMALDQAIETGKGAAKLVALTGVGGGPAAVVAMGAIGGAIGGVVGGGKEAALAFASSAGGAQDVMRCLDELNGKSSNSGSVNMQAEMWTEKLRKGEKVEIFAHSEGGIITRESLHNTRKALYEKKYAASRSAGLSAIESKVAASEYRDTLMSAVTVNSFGTLERDLPPGPTYNRMTNESDPVPEIIKAAQKNYGRPIDKDPPNSPAVHRFNKNPNADVRGFEAHGMPCYLEELKAEQEKVLNKQGKKKEPCC